MVYKDISSLKKISELLAQRVDQNKYKNGENYNYVNESRLDSFTCLNFIIDVENFFQFSFSSKNLSQRSTHTF